MGRKPFGTAGLVRITTAVVAVSLVVAGVALGQSSTGGARGSATVRNAVYVVLVSGINDGHGGKTPTGDCEGGGRKPCRPGSCASVGDLAHLCAALEADGDLVWVPPAATDSDPSAVLHTRLSVDANAASLASYIQNGASGALVVGHSGGGLIARAAIERYHAFAEGLFAIGTPFDGSFAADMLESAANAACAPTAEPGTLDARCQAIARDSEAEIRDEGPAAVADLTAAGRTADNSTLGPPNLPDDPTVQMPVWTFAGTPCEVLYTPGGYYSPNDGLAGESSAWGEPASLASGQIESANLGHVVHSAALTYNNPAIPEECGGDTPRGMAYPVELDDQTVTTDVINAAKALGTGCEFKGSCQGVQLGDAAAEIALSSAPAKPTRIVLSLTRVSGRVLKAGEQISLAPGTSLLSTGSFSLGCRGHRVRALSALGDEIFGFPPGAVRCSRVKLEGRGAKHLVMTTDGPNVKAVLAPGSTGKLSLTVTAKRPITLLSLKRGRRTLRVIRKKRGQRSIKLQLKATQALGLTVTATVAGHQYATAITALP